MNPHLVDIFLKLVKIYSPSHKEDKIRVFLVEFLKKLDIKVRIDKAGNLYFFLKGQGEPILLSAHMDTVEPCQNVRPVIENGIIKTDGSTILGADDKAGIANILFLVSTLKKERIKHRPVEVVFTVEEEVGCKGAQKLNYSIIKSKEAVVLDRSAPIESITLSTPFADKVIVTCRGKSTHSRSPEEGIHAISMFADFVRQVKFGRRNSKIVSNIGTVQGGRNLNAIPDEVIAAGDIRATDKRSLLSERKHWGKVGRNVGKTYKSKIDIEFENVILGFNFQKRDPFVLKIAQAIKEAGFHPSYTTAFGGSDANIFNEHGIKSVPLGQGRLGAHSLNEAIPVQALYDMHSVLLALVQKI